MGIGQEGVAKGLRRLYGTAKMELFALDDLMDYALMSMKVALACSPIIAIGLMLAFAHEDEETEEAKRKAAPNGCKT